jgi:hypothetical protein
MTTARTFCTDILHFPGRVLVIQRHGGGYGRAMLIPTRATCGHKFSRLRRQAREPAKSPWSEQPSGRPGQVAVSTEGHVAHNADRLPISA